MASTPVCEPVCSARKWSTCALLGMRAAAFIVTDPLLNARFRNRFVLTDSIDRMAGLYSLRSDEVAAFMI